jgi:serine/threonine protein phosphatase 1
MWLFVHAGVNPARLLKDQLPRDLLWIREPFLSHKADYGRLIVHGHSPTRDGKPDIHLNRINIDTGAVFGRSLTAAVFVESAQRFPSILQSDA